MQVGSLKLPIIPSLITLYFLSMYMGIFTETVGIDPGSQYLRIFYNNELIFNEPTQFSIDTIENKISGIGNQTQTSKNDIIVQPVNYAIGDFCGFEQLLRKALQQGFKSQIKSYKSYKMYFCLPSDATEGEKRTYRDSGEHAGAKEVYMVDQNVCAALGMNILFEKKDFILIEFGASKFEISIFVNSVPIAVGSFRMGTRKLFHLIQHWIFKKYHIRISTQEVEALLHSFDTTNQVRIGLATIYESELLFIIRNYFGTVNMEINLTLDKLSQTHNLSPVLKNGVYYTGGASASNYLRKQIEFEQNIAFTLSKTPLLDTINGLKKVVVQFKSYIQV